MLCKRPFMLGVVPCGCGQCLPCLINRRRIWSHRILLESYKHFDSCFVTLTYDDEHCPKDGSLVKEDYQLWLKRLRKVLSPKKIRFFLSGEYGEESGRPHFHVALFGVDRFVAGGDDGCSGVVRDTWKLGFTYVGELTYESAQYIAGYVTKKLGFGKNGTKLKGRVSEFSRMSLRPGIGRPAVVNVADVLQKHSGFWSIAREGDVPCSLRHGGRLLPLGRYLRRELRGELGLSKDTPKVAQEAYGKEMRKVCEDALLSSENRHKSLGKIIVDMNKQKCLNMEAKFKIKESRKTL